MRARRRPKQCRHWRAHKRTRCAQRTQLPRNGCSSDILFYICSPPSNPQSNETIQTENRNGIHPMDGGVESPPARTHSGPTNILVGSSPPLARLRRHPFSDGRFAQNTLHHQPRSARFFKNSPKISLGLYFMCAQVQYPGSILLSLVRRSKTAEYAMWADPLAESPDARFTWRPPLPWAQMRVGTAKRRTPTPVPGDGATRTPFGAYSILFFLRRLLPKKCIPVHFFSEQGGRPMRLRHIRPPRRAYCLRQYGPPSRFGAATVVLRRGSCHRGTMRHRGTARSRA